MGIDLPSEALPSRILNQSTDSSSDPSRSITMDRYTPLIALANAATVVAGGLIVLFAHRASRRTRSTSLRAAALGFGLVVVGAGLAGTVHLLEGSVAPAIALQSAFTAGGILTLLYSLYASPPPSAVRVDSSG